MSAAPIITSGPLTEDEFTLAHAKKARRETSNLPTEYINCPPITVSDAGIRLLQNEYPHLSQPFLSSILESTGGKIEAARAVVSQIVQVGIRHPNSQNRKRCKRSRNILDQTECDSDSSSCTGQCRQEESRNHGASMASEDVSNKRSYSSDNNAGHNLNTATVDGAVNELLRRLQGVATAEQARDRLKPVIEYMFNMRNSQGAEAHGILNKKTQKLLTRTIIHQSEALSATTRKMERASRINDELSGKIQSLEETKNQLENDVKRLRDANLKLSYFITTTVGQNGCDINKWRSGHDDNEEGGGGGYHGWGFNQSCFRSPDVF